MRQGFGPDARITVEVPQLQFLAKFFDVPVIFNDTPWSRLWLFSRATDYGGNREGDAAGAYHSGADCGVVPQIMEEDVPVICNDTYPWLSKHFSSRTRMLTCPCCARQVLMRLGPHSGSELGADFNPWTPASYAESMAVDDDESEAESESEAEVEEGAATRFAAGFRPLRVCTRFLEHPMVRPVWGCAYGDRCTFAHSRAELHPEASSP